MEDKENTPHVTQTTPYPLTPSRRLLEEKQQQELRLRLEEYKKQKLEKKLQQRKSVSVRGLSTLNDSKINICEDKAPVTPASQIRYQSHLTSSLSKSTTKKIFNTASKSLSAKKPVTSTSLAARSASAKKPTTRKPLPPMPLQPSEQLVVMLRQIVNYGESGESSDIRSARKLWESLWQHREENKCAEFAMFWNLKAEFEENLGNCKGVFSIYLEALDHVKDTAQKEELAFGIKCFEYRVVKQECPSLYLETLKSHIPESQIPAGALPSAKEDSQIIKEEDFVPLQEVLAKLDAKFKTNNMLFNPQEIPAVMELSRKSLGMPLRKPTLTSTAASRERGAETAPQKRTPRRRPLRMSGIVGTPSKEIYKDLLEDLNEEEPKPAPEEVSVTKQLVFGEMKSPSRRRFSRKSLGISGTPQKIHYHGTGLLDDTICVEGEPAKKLVDEDDDDIVINAPAAPYAVHQPLKMDHFPIVDDDSVVINHQYLAHATPVRAEKVRPSENSDYSVDLAPQPAEHSIDFAAPAQTAPEAMNISLELLDNDSHRQDSLQASFEKCAVPLDLEQWTNKTTEMACEIPAGQSVQQTCVDNEQAQSQENLAVPTPVEETAQPPFTIEPVSYQLEETSHMPSIMTEQTTLLSQEVHGEPQKPFEELAMQAKEDEQIHEDEEEEEDEEAEEDDAEESQDEVVESGESEEEDLEEAHVLNQEPFNAFQEEAIVFQRPKTPERGIPESWKPKSPVPTEDLHNYTAAKKKAARGMLSSVLSNVEDYGHTVLLVATKPKESIGSGRLGIRKDDEYLLTPQRRSRRILNIKQRNTVSLSTFQQQHKFSIRRNEHFDQECDGCDKVLSTTTSST